MNREQNESFSSIISKIAMKNIIGIYYLQTTICSLHHFLSTNSKIKIVVSNTTWELRIEKPMANENHPKFTIYNLQYALNKVIH